MSQNIISIENVAQSLNIKLDSGQTQTSKILDELGKEIERLSFKVEKAEMKGNEISLQLKFAREGELS